MNILRWPSVESYVRDARVAFNGSATLHPERGMTATMRFDEACERAINGDPSLTAGVRDLDLAIEAQHANAPRAAWSHGVTGSSMSPARYAMGHPKLMHRREPSPTDYRRCSIYVNTGLSAGTSYAQAKDRARAIVGLVSRLMSEGVDLDLYTLEDGEAPKEGLARLAEGKPWRDKLEKSDGSRDYCQVVRIETRPIVLEQVAFALCSPEVFSRLMLPAAIHGFAGDPARSWPHTQATLRREAFAYGWAPGRAQVEWIKVARKELGLAPHDLYIGSMQFDDAGLSIEAWIERYARQALGQEAA